MIVRQGASHLLPDAANPLSHHLFYTTDKINYTTEYISFGTLARFLPCECVLEQRIRFLPFFPNRIYVFREFLNQSEMIR